YTMIWPRCKRQSGLWRRKNFDLFPPRPLQSLRLCPPLEMCMRHYTVYGGSFDPIHFGHMSLVEGAIALVYESIIVPDIRHAFGKESAPFEIGVRFLYLSVV